MFETAASDQPEGEDPPSERAQLEAAISKAMLLVTDLERKAANLLEHPPALPAEQIAAGRAAMERAVDSARRLLNSLEGARKLTDRE